MSKRSKLTAVVVLVIVLIFTVYAYKNPEVCAVMDQENLNPTYCTCLGYERINATAVVGGYDSLCYGFVLSKSEEY